MRYWFYYSTQLAFSFPPDQNGRVEIFCTTDFGRVEMCCTILRYQLPRGISGGLALQCLRMIQRGRQIGVSHKRYVYTFV